MSDYKTYTLDVNCRIERKDSIEINIPNDVDIEDIVNKIEQLTNVDKIYNVVIGHRGYVSYQAHDYNDTEIIVEVEGRED